MNQLQSRNLKSTTYNPLKVLMSLLLIIESMKMSFRGVSTLVLNRTYKIPGYRISVSNRGKENEELTLRKDYSTPSRAPSVPDAAISLEELVARIENIEKFLEQLHT